MRTPPHEFLDVPKLEVFRTDEGHFLNVWVRFRSGKSQGCVFAFPDRLREGCLANFGMGKDGFPIWVEIWSAADVAALPRVLKKLVAYWARPDGPRVARSTTHALTPGRLEKILGAIGEAVELVPAPRPGRRRPPSPRAPTLRRR